MTDAVNVWLTGNGQITANLLLPGQSPERCSVLEACDDGTGDDGSGANVRKRVIYHFDVSTPQAIK